MSGKVGQLEHDIFISHAAKTKTQKADKHGMKQMFSFSAKEVIIGPEMLFVVAAWLRYEYLLFRNLVLNRSFSATNKDENENKLQETTEFAVSLALNVTNFHFRSLSSSPRFLFGRIRCATKLTHDTSGVCAMPNQNAIVKYVFRCQAITQPHKSTREKVRDNEIFYCHRQKATDLRC